MTDHLNATHTVLAAATLPQCIDDIAKTLHGTPTKTQLKAVETELKKLHKAGMLESTPGRGGVHYYSLTTPTQPAEPQPRPAAVAVQAAVKAQAPSDTTEQLRESRANELALSQTIVEICCAIGRDPAVTTTGELPQLVRKHIEAQAGSAARDLLAIHALLSHRVAGPTNPAEIKALECAERAATLIDDAVDEISTLLQYLNARDAELLAQAALVVDLRARIEAQVKQHQSDTGLLADKNQRLHAEIEHLRSQLRHAESIVVDPHPDAFFVLRHDWKRHVSRHKSREAAERTATSALRAGAGQADIYAVKRVAIGKRHPVIKTV